MDEVKGEASYAIVPTPHARTTQGHAQRGGVGWMAPMCAVTLMAAAQQLEAL